jgi:hypothetical protein
MSGLCTEEIKLIHNVLHDLNETSVLISLIMRMDYLLEKRINCYNCTTFNVANLKFLSVSEWGYLCTVRPIRRDFNY